MRPAPRPPERVPAPCLTGSYRQLMCEPVRGWQEKLAQVIDAEVADKNPNEPAQMRMRRSHVLSLQCITLHLPWSSALTSCPRLCLTRGQIS